MFVKGVSNLNKSRKYFSLGEFKVEELFKLDSLAILNTLKNKNI